MIIYKAKNLVNEKLYIGKTGHSLEQRRKEHFSAARKGSKTAFHSAIRKYGENNFKFSIIDNQLLFESELNDREKFYIQKYHSFNGNGYNLTPGGDGVYKGIISPFKGLTHRYSEQVLKKMRIAHIGISQSEESKEKRSIAMSGEKAHQWLGPNKLVTCKNESCKKTFKVRPQSNQKYCCKRCMYSDPERSKILSEKNKGKTHVMPEGFIQWNKGLTKETNSSVMAQSIKVTGSVAWNKGLTKNKKYKSVLEV